MCNAAKRRRVSPLTAGSKRQERGGGTYGVERRTQVNLRVNRGLEVDLGPRELPWQRFDIFEVLQQLEIAAGHFDLDAMAVELCGRWRLRRWRYARLGGSGSGR